jgi:hypothetical protein
MCFAVPAMRLIKPSLNSTKAPAISPGAFFIGVITVNFWHNWHGLAPKITGGSRANRGQPAINHLFSMG